MPASASLATGASTKAFDVPAGARGFLIWNEANAVQRFRVGAIAAASGADMGIPLPAGNTTPQFREWRFSKPLIEAVPVHVLQSSGGPLTVGFEILW